MWRSHYNLWSIFHCEPSRQNLPWVSSHSDYDLPSTSQQSPTQPSSLLWSGLCLGNSVLSPPSGMLISLIFLIAVSFTLTSYALSSEPSLLFSLSVLSFPLGFSPIPQFPSFLQHSLSYLKSSLFIYHVTPPRTPSLPILLIFKCIICVLPPQISKSLKQISIWQIMDEF